MKFRVGFTAILATCCAVFAISSSANFSYTTTNFTYSTSNFSTSSLNLTTLSTTFPNLTSVSLQ